MDNFAVSETIRGVRFQECKDWDMFVRVLADAVQQFNVVDNLDYSFERLERGLSISAKITTNPIGFGHFDKETITLTCNIVNADKKVVCDIVSLADDYQSRTVWEAQDESSLLSTEGKFDTESLGENSVLLKAVVKLLHKSLKKYIIHYTGNELSTRTIDSVQSLC